MDDNGTVDLDDITPKLAARCCGPLERLISAHCLDQETAAALELLVDKLKSIAQRGEPCQ